jgi:hypothetical protein
MTVEPPPIRQVEMPSPDFFTDNKLGGDLYAEAKANRMTYFRTVNPSLRASRKSRTAGSRSSPMARS